MEELFDFNVTQPLLVPPHYEEVTVLVGSTVAAQGLDWRGWLQAGAAPAEGLSVGPQSDHQARKCPWQGTSACRASHQGPGHWTGKGSEEAQTDGMKA